ncbi:MAG: DNA internalization-related competence protein ComEC/Rec2, partial [Betaproteobacteria bacterium]
GAPLRVMGAVLALPMFLVLPAGPREGELWVHLLDVGQGLATVIRTAHHTLVYDTGPKWNPDADSGNRIVVPFLRGEGMRDLDALIITHADDDHSGGVRSVVDARKPAWVMTSMDAASEILRGATSIRRCVAGERWRWDGVDFAILHPEADAYENAAAKTNNLGCVLKISSPGGSILMTADIEKPAEFQLLKRYKGDATTLRADVMVVPHHGSRTSSTEALIDAVSPHMALVPVGYRSRFRHPNAVVMDRYAARKIPVFRTDYLGAITVTFVPGSKPALSAFREQRQRYWLDMPLSETESPEP